MNALLDAFNETMRRWRLMLLLLLATVVWDVAFFLWLGIPVATIWQIILQALAALFLIAFPTALIVRLYRALGGGRFQPTPTLLIALVIATFTGLWLPYKLIWWIPQMTGITAQSFSLGVRFLAAGLLFSISLLWILVIAANPDGKELPAREP